MADLFWIIFLFPLVWPFIAKGIFGTRITWTEMTLNIVIVLVLFSGCWFIGKGFKMSDVEILNGHVTGKERLRVSCEHSYQCNCYTTCTGSGSNQTCSQTCSTCYEHLYDVDWRVDMDIGATYIARVDRQGTTEPPRWTAVKIGEPASLGHSFTNYVKAASSSLFHADDELVKKYKDIIPHYPPIYDYYRVNHIISINVPIDGLAKWNYDIAERLKRLGPKKQANVIVVFVNNSDPNYAYGLRAAWQGFKKNDIIIVVGVTQYPKIDWVNVMSWSKNDMLNVMLRDEIMSLKEISRSKFLDVVENITLQYFERRSMEEFQYLKDDIEPPLSAMIFATIIALFGSPLLTYYFQRRDVNIAWR